VNAQVPPTGAGFSRRNFLSLTGLSVAAVAVGGSLASCTSGDAGAGAAAGGAVKLPTYKEFTGVKPDLPGTAQGVQQGFLRMPSTFVTSVPKPPLSGPVTAMTETFNVPPTPMSSNPFWKELNTKLGGDLKLTIGTDPGYPEKFATMLAGGDLPDMVWLPSNQGIPNIAQMLNSQFADLTKYLSGDAVLEYPNLAALKPAVWKSVIVDGRLWGPPVQSTSMGQVYLGNPRLWNTVGGIQSKSADEFYRKAKELTDPRRKVYALAPDYVNAVHMFGEWHGAPNGWSASKSGKLTNRFETEEYQAAIEFAAKLFAAGCFYPDATIANAVAAVAQGTIGAYVEADPSQNTKLRQYDPALAADILIPFGWDGKTKPTYDMKAGGAAFTVIKKTSESKIRQLLGVLNYVAAPFGTAEYLQVNFGEEGKDFTFDSAGNPVVSKSAQANVALSGALQILATPEQPIYSMYPEDTRRAHAAEMSLIEFASFSATTGAYSNTDVKLGPKLTSQLYDKLTDVVTGRAKIGDWQAAVKRWRAEGGDKIRSEYEAALAKGVTAGS